MGRNNIKILLDTNFLILGITEKIDIISGIKECAEGQKDIFILKDSVMELEKLAKKGNMNAKIAVENILKQEIKILDIKGPKDVDEKILQCALDENAYIATLDGELAKRAKSKGLKIIAYNKSKKKAMVK